MINLMIFLLGFTVAEGKEQKSNLKITKACKEVAEKYRDCVLTAAHYKGYSSNPKLAEDYQSCEGQLKTETTTHKCK